MRLHKLARCLQAIILLVAIPALACIAVTGGGPAATETAEAASVMTNLAPTATGAASDTPAPPTDTPEPEATATVDEFALVTQTAEAAIDEIRATLPTYGVGADEGSLGWVHQPVTVEVRTFKEASYASDYPTVIVADFVAQADVTWITDTGLAGCGFMFRADPQTETFYGMGVFRGGTGVAAFNEWQNGVSARWDRYRDAPTTNPQNGATNTLAVVARGSQFSFYVNGQVVDTVSNADLPLGAVGFAAFSESGTTTCSFSNGWLWVLN
jgi:hypothetical protein